MNEFEDHQEIALLRRELEKMVRLDYEAAMEEEIRLNQLALERLASTMPGEA
ncbi:MAG: hypothetical protein ACREIS_05600 [Nitrospiraceae bacterium]